MQRGGRGCHRLRKAQSITQSYGGADQPGSTPDGTCLPFVEGALEVISKVGRLVPRDECGKVVHCDHDLGAFAQEGAEPCKRPYAEHVGGECWAFCVCLGNVVRRDAFECKGKQAEGKDSRSEREERRDGESLQIRTCPNEEGDGVAGPEEQQDGRRRPCAEVV